MKSYQVPEAGRQARGTAIVNLLRLGPDEKVSGLIPIETFDQDVYLLMSTKNGWIKKTKLRNYRNIHRGGLIAINLRKDDELVGVELVTDKDDVILATNQGKAIRFKQSDVRATARNTMGVKGITLSNNDFVIGMVTTEANGNLLIVTEKGFGKATDLNEYRVQNRGGKGIITYKITERTGKAVKIALIEKDDNCDLLLINDQGIVIRIATSEIPLLSRNTQGVTLMRSKEGEGKVIDLAIVYPEDDENSEIDTGDNNNQLEINEEIQDVLIENKADDVEVVEKESDDEDFAAGNEDENFEHDLKDDKNTN